MTFDKAFEIVIGHEGKYVNDPSDPGGETNYGISKRAYPNEDIKNLKLDRVKQIYYNDYWLKSKADSIPTAIRYAHFDMAVNAGLRSAAKNLQRAARVTIDGSIGPATLSAASNVTLPEYLFFRATYYMKITNRNPKLAKFGKGWANRIESMY